MQQTQIRGHIAHWLQRGLRKTGLEVETTGHPYLGGNCLCFLFFLLVLLHCIRPLSRLSVVQFSFTLWWPFYERIAGRKHTKHVSVGPYSIIKLRYSPDVRTLPRAWIHSTTRQPGRFCIWLIILLRTGSLDNEDPRPQFRRSREATRALSSCGKASDG